MMRPARRYMRWGSPLTVLGTTLPAFAIDTATLISSALSPDCLAWRVVGVCYWLPKLTTVHIAKSNEVA
ncbi:hypothetical protein AWB83_00130 [Caballeronia ptereochthonis]|uniref:Secreted protein n=1 Tax=Caballeronia ptereochthonis TaxID=1777144 RepID=A0A157Z321_9BURK|nr:hypothetical protein AWB83_00130 [Caballeronia ptereochthonis]